MVKVGYFLSCEEFDAPELVPDEDVARRTAHQIWRNDAPPGELAQVLLLELR